MDDKVDVRPSWGLAWGLFWRIFLISLGISVIVGGVMFLIGMSFIPWASFFSSVP